MKKNLKRDKLKKVRIGCGIVKSAPDCDRKVAWNSSLGPAQDNQDAGRKCSRFFPAQQQEVTSAKAGSYLNGNKQKGCQGSSVSDQYPFDTDPYSTF